MEEEKERERLREGERRKHQLEVSKEREKTRLPHLPTLCTLWLGWYGDRKMKVSSRRGW